MDSRDLSKEIEFKNFIAGDLDLNTHIWRYLTLTKYLDILYTNSLFMCRTDKFQDQYEGTPNSYTNDLIDNSFGEFSNSSEMRQQWKDLIAGLRIISFISCWHMAEKESLRMWREYCPKGGGVLVKSSILNLQNSLADISVGHLFMAPVNYENSINNETSLENGMKLLCYKRSEFSYENEFRLILLYLRKNFLSNSNEDSYTVTPPEKGFKYPVDIKKLIEDVYLSRDMSFLDRIRLSLLTRIALGKWPKISSA